MVNADYDELRGSLLLWWETYQRHFPWRESTDPYHVFVAEVLLHRTRAAQVVDLFHRTLRAYPTVEALADADETALSRMLFSAGLRWRVDLLLSAARDIRDRFGGKIPRDQLELQSIPGVGHYIASAIRCFAFGDAVAVVDVNTVRVIGRVFDWAINDSVRRSRKFHELAASVLDVDHPREFNFALLDLAALVCTPRNPRCTQCPLQLHCATGKARLSNQSAATSK